MPQRFASASPSPYRSRTPPSPYAAPTGNADRQIELNTQVQQVEPSLDRIPLPTTGPIYRSLFISPANAANPVERLQIAQVSSGDAAYPYVQAEADLQKVDQSIRYLNGSSQARASIDAGLRGGVKVDINRDGQTQYQSLPGPGHPKYRVIDWDPQAQLQIMDDQKGMTGDYQSPALGLGHEFDHFSRPNADQTPDFLYGTKGERSLVEQFETPVANELGEPTRTNHWGYVHWTDDPTALRGGVLHPSARANGYDYDRYPQRWR